MSNEHHGKHHKEHHSAHEHAAGSSKKDKLLGFELNVIVLLAGLLIATAIVATLWGYNAGANSIQTPVSTTIVSPVLLKSKVQDYINENLLNDPSVSAKIIDVNSVGGGLYSLSFEIYQNNALVSAGVLYANKDKLIIGQAFDLNTPLPKPTTQPTQQAQTQPVKTDKPVVDLYVMSFCPFGNKAEDTMLPVYKLLKDKAEFNVHYIVNVDGDTVYSLHGQPEVVQNQREACVLQEYGKDAWFSFVTYVNTNCGSNGSCWEAGASTLKIDSNKINSCVAKDGLALMKKSEVESNSAGANGSPTLLINGVNTSAVYQYGNSEAYKKAICDSFTNPPSECSVALSAATSTTTGGSC